MEEKEPTGFVVIDELPDIKEIKLGWRSPSNIALVKYWGKRPGQIPENPSVSLTLSASYTDSYCTFKRRESDHSDIRLKYFFEGKENSAFAERIIKWFKTIKVYFPFLTHYEMVFESANSFPHSAGIASSASAMSSIALCLCEMYDTLYEKDKDFLLNASFIARLGSGSASRSVFPHAAIWGAMDGSKNEYALPMSEKIDPVFHSFQDSILIVDDTPKSVSSSLGHGLMNDNPFAKPRYDQARKNMKEILSAMEKGDLEKTGEIIEEEALSLHAMMMLSNYMLLKPGSLGIIEAVREIRLAEKWPLYFTIDAGPNIHLLYPDSIKSEVKVFMNDVLKPFCKNGQIIFDHVGGGPQNLIS